MSRYFPKAILRQLLCQQNALCCSFSHSKLPLSKQPSLNFEKPHSNINTVSLGQSSIGFCFSEMTENCKVKEMRSNKSEVVKEDRRFGKIKGTVYYDKTDNSESDSVKQKTGSHAH